MKIRLNGQEAQFETPEPTIINLLRSHNVQVPEMVSVQLNGEIIKSEHYGTAKISANDEVEFLYFMGGGALTPQDSGWPATGRQ